MRRRVGSILLLLIPLLTVPEISANASVTWINDSGQPLYFDGRPGTYLEIKNDKIGTDFDFSSNSFTISWWQYTGEAQPEEAPPRVFRAGTNESDFAVEVGGPDNDISFWNKLSRRPGVLPGKINEWTHYAIMEKRSGTDCFMTWAVNGFVRPSYNPENVPDPLPTYPCPSTQNSSDMDFFLGGAPGNTKASFKGAIAGFQIYKSVSWEFRPSKPAGEADFEPPTDFTENNSDLLVSLFATGGVIANGKNFDATAVSSGVSQSTFENPLTPEDTSPTWSTSSGDNALYFNGQDSATITIDTKLEDTHLDLSNDFTISWWQYTTTRQLRSPRILQFGTGAQINDLGVSVEVDGMYLYLAGNVVSGPVSVPLDRAWNHIAVVKTDCSYTWYINGKERATKDNWIKTVIPGLFEDTVTYTCPDPNPHPDTNGDIYVGGATNGMTFTGLVAGLQIANEKRWSEEFTPSTDFSDGGELLRMSISVSGSSIADKAVNRYSLHAENLKYAALSNPSRVFSYITIKATTDEKPFDSSTSSNKNPTVIGALDLGDVLDPATCIQTFDSRFLGNAKTLSVHTGCKIKASGVDHTNNYDITFETSVGKITKITPVCTITGYSVRYDGKTHTATGSCKGTGGSILTGLNLTNTTHTEVGTYASDTWNFTDATGYYYNASGTVSNVIREQAVELPPTPPTPVPYLKTLNRPKIARFGTQILCTAGTYQVGTLTGGKVDSQSDYQPESYSYSFLKDGKEILTGVSPGPVIPVELSLPDEESLITCSISVTWNSLQSTASSSGTGAEVTEAKSQRDAEIAAALREFEEGVKQSHQSLLEASAASYKVMSNRMTASFNTFMQTFSKSAKSKSAAKAMNSAFLLDLKTRVDLISDVIREHAELIAATDAQRVALMDTRNARIASARQEFADYLAKTGFAVIGTRK